MFLRAAAIAQWIRLRLPSCCPGLESQVHHQRFLENNFFKSVTAFDLNKFQWIPKKLLFNCCGFKTKNFKLKFKQNCFDRKKIKNDKICFLQSSKKSFEHLIWDQSCRIVLSKFFHRMFQFLILLFELTSMQRKLALSKPWSSGYERRLTSNRLWVRIPVPYTAWS